MRGANNAFLVFRFSFTTFLAERLKVLLETRHLYQKLSLDPLDILAPLRAELIPTQGEPQDFEKLVAAYLGLRFPVSDKVVLDANNHPIGCFVVSNVKLFCSGTCGG